MIEVDLHTHSLFSSCGLHTTIEMLEKGKALGMKGLAITDHGPALGGRLSSVFFTRLEDPVPGIRLLKGVECNLLEEPGRIDCPQSFLPHMDVVLLGIHSNTDAGLGKARLTQMLLQAIKNNQYVDAIAHLDSAPCEIDYGPIVREALKCDMVVEINNSKSRPGVASPEATQELIAVCKKLECPIVVSSDAHALNEVGRDDLVRPLLERARFPVNLIVNRDAQAAFRFVEANRRKRQMAAIGPESS